MEGKKPPQPLYFVWEEDPGECCYYCFHFNRPYCERCGDVDHPMKKDTDWCEKFQEEGHD